MAGLAVSGYGEAAGIYLARGWRGVLPLPESRKFPPPRGYTGWEAAEPDAETVARWRAEFPRGNVGLRLPDGVVGLDVDSYGSKPGGASLYRLVEELGPLPSTHCSTSRRRLGDDLSSIRLYRVPAGTRLRSEAAPGVEVVQRGHRYAVVWPSWHPDVDAQYEWWGPDGLEAEPPGIGDLPELPPSWVEGLRAREGPGEVGGGDGSGPGDLRGAGSYSGLVERFVARARAGMGCHDAGRELANQLRDNLCPREDAERTWLPVYFEATRGLTDRDSYTLEELLRGVDWAYSGQAREPLPAFRGRGGASLAAEVLPPPGRPWEVACELRDRWSRGGVPLVRRWRESWVRWREGEGWTEVGAEAVQAGLYETLGAAWFEAEIRGEGDGGGEDGDGAGVELRPWNPNLARVRNVVDALEGALFLDDGVGEGSWLDGRRDPPAGEVVAVRNGLLHAETRRLLPADPRFFSRTCLPLDYDGGAGRPDRWLRFLDDLWGDDPEAVEAVQEIFGYLISTRTDLQRIPLLVGPTRSGKSTLARVLTELVGRRNVCAPTLTSLGTQFGMQALLGKSLAVIGDARVGGDTREIVARLLGISGEDLVSADRKNRSHWTGKLGVRFLILSNEVPGLRDASGALARRFVPVTLRRSWLGAEDHQLLGALLEELPGILNWALEGLERVGRTGVLSVPGSSAEVVTALQDAGSPISVFLRECCQLGEGLAVTALDLFRAWSGWSEAHGYRAGNSATLGRDLQAVIPGLTRERMPHDAVPRGWFYRGLSLTDEGIRYLYRG